MLAHISYNNLKKEKEWPRFLHGMIEPTQISWSTSLKWTVNWNSTHINLIDIQMTDGYVVLDAPMSLLAKFNCSIYLARKPNC